MEFFFGHFSSIELRKKVEDSVEGFLGSRVIIQSRLWFHSAGSFVRRLLRLSAQSTRLPFAFFVRQGPIDSYLAIP